MSNKLQPFPWYGAKYKWLDFLLPKLPTRKRYVEAFGGSASVLLNRQAAPIEAYNDLDSAVVNFFHVLRETPEELIQALERTPYHEGEFDLAQQTDYSDSQLGEVGEVELELARRFFVSSTMAYNSATGTGSFSYSTNQSRRGMAQHTSRFKSKISELEEVADRLSRVQFFQQDAVAFLERFDKSDTLQYLDPPYPADTRGGTAYKHEMDRNDHLRLIEYARQSNADVEISTYQCDLYDSLLLSGWNRLDSDVKQTAASNSDQDRVESLYVNYEVPSGGFGSRDELQGSIGDFA